jgi:hypothetical protein
MLATRLIVLEQTLLAQRWSLLAQRAPQDPQFQGLVVVLTQLPLQQVRPEQQAGPPEEHVAESKAPQAAASVGFGDGEGDGDGDGDGGGEGEGEGDGLGLGGLVHVRETQVWPAGQTLLQDPQLLVSLDKLTHTAEQGSRREAEERVVGYRSC